MHYYVVRGDQRFGPYTLADLERYRATGNLSDADLVVTGDENPRFTLHEILQQNITPQSTLSDASTPLPANLPWWAVLILTIVSCGLFSPVWLLVIALWVRRLDPMSNAVWAAAAFLVLRWGTEFFAFVAVLAQEGASGSAAAPGLEGAMLLLRIPAFIAYVVAAFSLKSSLENCLSKEMSYPVALGPFMTFFFAPIYFQYHLDDLIRSRRAIR